MGALLTGASAADLQLKKPTLSDLGLYFGSARPVLYEVVYRSELLLERHGF